MDLSQKVKSITVEWVVVRADGTLDHERSGVETTTFEEEED